MTTLSTAARNAACDAVVDMLDGGTLEFQTASDVEVSTLTLGTPAFGAASNGTATANAMTPDASSTGGGPITKGVFKDSGGTAVVTVTVSTVGNGGEIELTSTTIAAGEPITISSYTHTQPAS